MKDIFTNSAMRIAKGIAIACIVTLVLLLIYAVLLTYTNIEEGTMAPVIILITAVSILVREFYSEQVQLRKME